MKALILVALLAISTIAVATNPTEIILMKGSTKSIHLQQVDNYNLFQLCTEIEEGIDCKRIGSATDQELIEITKKESAEAKKNAWITIPIWTAGAVVVSQVLARISLQLVFSTQNNFPFIAAVIASAGIISIPIWTKKINPWYQFNQANVLDDIAGKAIGEVSDRKVVKTANLLQSILN